MNYFWRKTFFTIAILLQINFVSLLQNSATLLLQRYTEILTKLLTQMCFEPISISFFLIKMFPEVV